MHDGPVDKLGHVSSLNSKQAGDSSNVMIKECHTDSR